MKKVSTTRLSKILNIPLGDLFDKLLEENFVCRKNDNWVLTDKGMAVEGEMSANDKFGEFIVWPDDFNPFIMKKNNERTGLMNATSIAIRFNLTPQRLNLIFSEIGWTEKAIKGWQLTPFGKKAGGVQVEHASGGTYVLWPKEIISNQLLKDALNDKQPTEPDKNISLSGSESNCFRKKFPANLRTKDGHMVRSRAEVIIDNALYHYGLAHAYERKLPIEEDVYSDFYIPSQNGSHAVYIEFWGLENDPGYAERKKVKQEIYAQNDLNLIELDDKHIENLDDHLPRLLLKYGIRVE